jgi:large subunit ribosomal protein L14
MIQNESIVVVADNTWATKAKVIRVIKWSRSRFATVGDIVVVAIKSASSTWQIEKWSVQKWVVIRTRKEIWREDWTYIRFADNAIALVNSDHEPRWKRIFGPVARELRAKWFKTVANLAEEII